MATVSPADFEAVRRVVAFLRLHPEELQRDELREFRAYLESMGGAVPTFPQASKACKKQTEKDEEDATSEPDEELWELEEIEEEAIPQVTGDPTPENEEKAMELKALAAERAGEDKMSEAIELMTKALHLVPGKAMYWSQRASYLLSCKRPGAALRDADRALAINPENVRALRVRGTVRRHLGRWEEALKDLSEAQIVDYDEKTDDLLRFVQQRVNERRRLQRQKEEVSRQQQQQPNPASFASGIPNSFPSGFPGGAMPQGMEALLSDPEILAAMQDPDVASKLPLLMQNPMAALQMMGDPKLGPLLNKIMAKMMSGGCFPGAGFPGNATTGQSGAGGAGAGAPNVGLSTGGDLD
ncbi:hypothetical protein ERJ75_001431800 [Trypanosoma vivax]|uniref:Putative Hsc70-interacting protein (Hip) n=1 Tax=Trypanosoma vivax (strain Y486) TaxID=1055687 RepID=G0TTM0_TRYVY|nr:putative Hsc70-interacting protein (Hip) [Trypanosoma vivax]KAH8607236.1 hypothetical protein ERJ75_001431800 [Trypanosoma vivax]CCC47301.1 putative Hsc70-interacting protein (Hip) [Trypanosoma vivax Y486]